MPQTAAALPVSIANPRCRPPLKNRHLPAPHPQKDWLLRSSRTSRVLSFYGLTSPPYKLLWNHNFFWESMQPDGGKMPTAGLLQQIEKDFGSFTNFKDEFATAAMRLFGSGWVWLVLKPLEKRLAVVRTSNTVNPLALGDILIINLDMWEHAYYLDYKNDRAKYVNVFMNHLVSWHSAVARMARAEAFVNLGEPKIPVA